MPLRLLRFYKPYGVLSQFTPEGRWAGLKSYIDVPDVHAAGRLDADSEGLLLLTNHGPLQAHIADPRHKMPKTYWVQVEGIPSEEALEQLRRGVALNDGMTQPAQVRRLDAPELPPRNPPIRVRASIPDCWIELTIREGRNRQVRRMTAAVGHPTLRLLRVAIGPYTLAGLTPGQWQDVPQTDWPALPPGGPSLVRRPARGPARTSLSTTRSRPPATRRTGIGNTARQPGPASRRRPG